MTTRPSHRTVAALFVAVACLIPAAAARAEQKVHLFILSGQSNMVGLNPDLSFTPTVAKALAPDKVIVVKDAVGGQPIRRWYKKWQPPRGMEAATPAAEPNGDLYDRLMGKVKSAVQDRPLGGPKGRPDTVTFVWMQGERDAKGALSEVYAESFKGLIAQFQADLGRTDINVVIGRLSDNYNAAKPSAHWTRVREIQVKLAQDDPRIEWVDTDDLNGPGNGLHYTKEGYVELGKRFADKALALIAKDAKSPAASPAAAAPAASAPVAAQAAVGNSKPWFFIVAADPQMSGKEIDEQNWINAIKHINRLRPDFVVVCGDLTFGGNKSEDRVKPLVMERDNRLAETYARIVAGLDKAVALYNVAGNHDVGQNPSAATIEWFTKRFGKCWQSFEHKGSLFISLESNLLRDGSAGADLAEQELTWLKATLADAMGKPYAHKMLFMHHPLYVKSVDEKDSYENIPAPRRAELLKLFHDSGIQAAFFGHRHMNEYIKDGRLEMITTTVAALGASPKNNPHGVRIVEVYPDRIEQNFYSYETLPEKVTLRDK